MWRSNFRATGTLHDYLVKHQIVGLAGIDTRALVRRIRTQGAMKGVLSSVDLDDASLVEKAQSSPGLVGRDLVREVIPDRATCLAAGTQPLGSPAGPAAAGQATAPNCMWWRWTSA